MDPSCMCMLSNCAACEIYITGFNLSLRHRCTTQAFASLKSTHRRTAARLPPVSQRRDLTRAGM